MKDALSIIGLFFVCIYGLKYFWKFILKPIHEKVPYDDGSRLLEEKYGIKRATNDDGKQVEEEKSAQTPALIQPRKSVYGMGFSEQMAYQNETVDDVIKRLERENNDHLKMEEAMASANPLPEKVEKNSFESFLTHGPINQPTYIDEVQEILEVQAKQPSFPKNREGMKKIPNLDFSWQPISTNEEIKQQTADEWKKIAKNEDDKTLFATMPNEDTHPVDDYYAPYDVMDSVPKMISGDFIQEEEKSWVDEINHNEIEVGSLDAVIIDTPSQNQSRFSLPTNDMGEKHVPSRFYVARVIGTEGKHIHVECANKKAWMELIPDLRELPIKQGDWYNIKVRKSKGKHFPLVLEAEPYIEAVSNDFSMSDELVSREFEEQGLKAYKN